MLRIICQGESSWDIETRDLELRCGINLGYLGRENAAAYVGATSPWSTEHFVLPLVGRNYLSSRITNMKT